MPQRLFNACVKCLRVENIRTFAVEVGVCDSLERITAHSVETKTSFPIS